MKISDELLLAYVDNELDAAARAEVEAAMAADPELARRVDQQRTLRKLLGAAYDPVLHEAVPPRIAAAAQAPGARVVDLDSARNKRKRQAGGWGWAQWGGMAAALLVGVVVGGSGWVPMGENVASVRGRLVARGELARALSLQLASAQPADAPVRLGVSFVSRDHAYCRSFTLAGRGAAGLACRQGDDWVLRLLDQPSTAAPAGADLRMAAAPLPPAVLRAIDEQIETALDAPAEQAAQRQGWRATGR
ncbi:MAG: hypothetical protein ACJ8G7_08820 [Rhizobacter sp.]